MDRTLHLTNPLMHGHDVTLIQQLLHQHGRLPGSGVDGVYGPATGTAVVQAKHALGYPAKLCLPIAGKRLLGFLQGAPRPADYRLRARSWRIQHNHATKTTAMRARIVANARWGCQHEPDIHYAEIRPIPLPKDHVAKLPLTTDCSGFATLCYYLAGAPDPNGLNYNGSGYTGTLLAHGKPITRAQAKPGDLVVYGAYPGHHTAVIVENDGLDPLTVSHGQEAGPFQIRVSDEARYQPPGITYLTFLP